MLRAVLSDDILHSVLKRGGKDMVSLDISCCAKLITDFSLDLIGQTSLTTSPHTAPLRATVDHTEDLVNS